MRQIRLFSAIWFTAMTMVAGAQTVSVKGQMSSWGILNFDDLRHPQLGIRYIPALYGEAGTGSSGLFDGEASVNMYGSTRFSGGSDGCFQNEVKPYRAWIRYSTPQLEVRLGLQKINFGPARMLRPLMWFDMIDPRDPLQLTDGVWGGLVRYYFLNNTNIWAWALVGNEDPKGWEVFGSDGRTPEYGGRIQVPVPAGEAGFSYHHRRVSAEGFAGVVPGLSRGRFMEDRYALDCRLDITIGLWCEAALTRQAAAMPFRTRTMINLGADYTFGLGNGLLVTAEHLAMRTGEDAGKDGEDFHITGASANYPLGLLDAATVMVYRDWESESWYRFFSFQRTYDRWQLFFIAFWNPDQFQIYRTMGDENLFAGRGIQLMAVFNH